MKEDRNKITALHNNIIRCIKQSICQQEQWLALLPDSQKGLRSNPPSGQGLSVDLSLSLTIYIYIYFVSTVVLQVYSFTKHQLILRWLNISRAGYLISAGSNTGFSSLPATVSLRKILNPEFPVYWHMNVRKKVFVWMSVWMRHVVWSALSA